MTITIAADNTIVVSVGGSFETLTVKQAELAAAKLTALVGKIKTTQTKDLKTLGDLLLGRMIDAIRAVEGSDNPQLFPICCTCFTSGFGHPNIGKDGVPLFWINTGRMTQMDGWHTQEEIEKFIASGKRLVDKAKF